MDKPEVLFADEVDIDTGQWGSVLTFKVGNTVHTRIGLTADLAKFVLWQLEKELQLTDKEGK